MSLAASSGVGGMGGGGGAMASGLAMANHANAMARPAQPTPPPDAGIPPSGFGVPPSAAAMGADLVDKQQALSLKQVRDLSGLPLVGIDLYAKEPHVSTFPPKPTDPAANPTPALVGKMKSVVSFQPTEMAHKSLRKWLTKSKGYRSLQTEALAKLDDDNAVLIENPQQWVGLRRLADAPEFIRASTTIDDSTTPAIAEETSQGIGVTMTNSTLDGSVPQGDDFDRVVCKIRLHKSKKAFTVLPEEAVQLLLNQAQYHVARKNKVDLDDEDIVNYPCAIAVPAYYCTDSGVEGLLDATGGTGVLFQRSVCALAGALLPGSEGKPNLILEQINKVQMERHKEFQKKQVKDPNARFEEHVLLLLAGMTSDGVEITAIQISDPQQSQMCCLFGNYKVICNVSYQGKNPEKLINKAISDIYTNLDTIASDLDGPVGLVTYGSSEDQKVIQTKWDAAKKNLEDWEEVPTFTTKADCVTMGTSVLGAVSHGRVSTVVQVPGKKPKAQLAIRVQNVAPVAVGIQMNYHGGDPRKWTPVKTIFDFDRRVPAGPFPIELNAAECVVYREGKTDLSEEDLLKAIKSNEGSKAIPKREEAALNLRIQIVQKWTRDGEWKKIGDVMSPLVDSGSDDENKKVACEKVTSELSLGPTGLISHGLVGERESVVQAVKTARNSALQWYLGVFLAIAFFGGFLIKSYWEERVFERDTRRLLAYYKHVIPGSLSDGDENNARYLVWKYRGKKEKLWRNLEKKYGEPVLHEHEWPDEEEVVATPEADEAEDLDATDDSESNDEEEAPDL